MPTRSKVWGFVGGSGMVTPARWRGLGELRGVESRDTGGVAPFIILGESGDLPDSRSESSVTLGVSERLLREELGLEPGVSALDEGLEELFFLGERVSSS